MNTYDCTICGNVNHASRFHCSTCGTIPARYSWTGKPIRMNTRVCGVDESTNATIEVFVAFGVERQSCRRTIKRTARTVNLDYYAEC